jgi:hypothetical protein
LSIQRADTVSDMPKSDMLSPLMSAANDMAPLPQVARGAATTNYEECLACQ